MTSSAGVTVDGLIRRKGTVMEEIDKRRAEWLTLEAVLSKLEAMRDTYPLDADVTRACYQVQHLADKAEQRHFDAAMQLRQPVATL